MGSTGRGDAAVATSPGDVIRSRRADLLAQWEAEVRKLPEASGLDPVRLADDVPRIVDRIAEVADELASEGRASMPQSEPYAHALERLKEGFDLKSILSEYAILRACIARLFRGDARGLSAVDGAIDAAIVATAERYFDLRQALERGLDRVATAALGSRGIDELLGNLLRVLLELAHAADAAAILVREGDALRAHASVGLGDALAACPAPAAEAERCVGEALASRGARARVALPLEDELGPLGVLHVASVAVDAFPEGERRLLEAVARRASVAIRQELLRADAEARAREAESARQRLQGVIASIQDGVLVVDASGRVVLANEAAARIFGRSSAELCVPVDDYPRRFELRGEDGRPAEPIAARTLRGERVATVERFIQVGGARRVLRTSASPLPNGDGGVVLVSDVTERRRAEEAHRFVAEAGVALAESVELGTSIEALAGAAVRGLADVSAVLLAPGIDAEGPRVATAHRDPAKAAALEEMRRRVLADPARLALASTRAAPALYGRFDEAHWLPLLRDDAERAAARALGVSSAMLVPLVTRGEPLGVLALGASARRFDAVDLSAAESLAARGAIALETAMVLRESRRAARLRDDILAIVSHDLRNPLNAITIGAEVLSAKLGAEPGPLKTVETIKRSASRMAHLISDLLDMASIRAGRLSIDRHGCELAPILTESVELQDSAAHAAGVTLARTIDVDAARVMCDRERVQQVLANLIGNAVKFCRPGDTVRVCARIVDHDALVEVEDTGPGIPPDHLPHVFEPYWSSARGRQGMGLGLFISKGIIDAHGGQIWVESAPGEGTTFTFTLPLADARA